MTVHTLTIDGKECAGSEGQTVLEVARESGVEIPTLCHLDGLCDVGACRLCVVEVKGSSKLLPSCTTAVAEGMEVTTDSDRLVAYRKAIIEMLFAERNHICAVCVANNHCELQAQADDLGLTQVSLMAVAKGPDRDAGRETLFMAGRQPLKLEPRDPVLYFIQRLRDEAHRFVIGSHRKLRKKDIREAGLQEIAGIGPSRKRALLHHFGTLKEIERASLADLGKVPGISAESARRIFEVFHAQPG